MAGMHNVSFIGAGNLAWHLAPALDNAGYAVREVYSRSAKSAGELVNRLYQAEIKSDLDFSDSLSQLFIIAVSDDAIAAVAREIILPDRAILLHTSGSRPIDVLSYAASERTGVFYPLQTFSRQKKTDLSQVPFCIEAESKDTEMLLMAMGRSISRHVIKINSADRKALHVAAVIACNFVNHFFKIASDVLKEKKIDFSLLRPLITETLTKTFEIGPENAQTGPARRHDLETLDDHMEYLSHDQAVAEIYRVVSQHIIDSYPEV